MPRDFVRFESNERADIGDVVALERNSRTDTRSQTLELLYNSNITDARIRKVFGGFQVTEDGGGASAFIDIAQGSAASMEILPGGEEDKGLLFGLAGSASQTLDFTGQPNATYDVYVRFTQDVGALGSRVFWNQDSSTEDVAAINTREIVAWDVQYATSSPGSEWIPIASVVWAGATIATVDITHTRDLFYEGDEGASFAQVWGDGGNDRNADRGQYGIKDLFTFVGMVRRQLTEIIGGTQAFYEVPTASLGDFAAMSRQFDTLEDAVGALAVGDTFILNEDDAADIPGAEFSANIFSATLGAIVDLDVTAGSFVGIDAASGVARTRDGTTTIATYIPSNAGTPISVVSDGRYTVIAYGQWIECFDHDTGVPQWAYDHGASVYDVAIGPTHVYLVGVDSANVSVRAILLSAGTSTWDYDHNATVFSVAYAGRVILIGGNASGHGSAATFRTLQASNGYDQTNEGGTGTSIYAGILGVFNGTIGTCTGPKQIATDGKIFAIRSSTTKTIDVYSMLGLGNISNTTPNEIIKLAMDQDLILACTDNAANVGEVMGFNHDLQPIWIYRELAPTEKAMTSLATDGAAIIAARPTTAGGNDSVRLRRGNRTRVWRMADVASDVHLALRQLAIPGD